MRRDDTDRWILRKPASAVPRLRLFCFPYAGGGASIYRNWAAALPADVEVCAVRLPGREGYLGEPPIRRISQAVDLLSTALSRYLDLPFAVFGHSMGALLGYEVTRRLLADTGRQPCHLFVSGHRAPHLPPRRPRLHDLDDDGFLAGIKALNGTPAEVFEHRELIDLLLPLLRADLELVETYAELPGRRLSCPVTALGGDADLGVPAEDIAAWRIVTRGPFEPALIEGDHFYINTARSILLEVIRDALDKTSNHDDVACLMSA
jgi:medium-chain acyl-[acyl-carrier-protein] hydrolase